MSDVSSRAFQFFLTFEREGRLDIDALLVGLPVTRSELERRGSNVSWDVWAELCERFGRVMGTAEQVEACGAAVVDPSYLGALQQIVGMLSDPRDLYRVGVRWYAPTLYRNLRFVLQDPPNGPLELVVEIPAGQAGSEAFLRMTAGGLRAIPRLMGLPDAAVEATISPHRGLFAIHLPPSPPARSFLRRAVAAFRGADAVVAELTEQQARLAESYDALAQAERGFRSVLEALPVAVGVHRDGTLSYVNPALARLVGVDKRQLVGLRWTELVDPDQRPILERLAADPAAIAELSWANGVVECGVLDGFVFDGEPAGLFFAVDVTLRKAAERAAARTEELNRILLGVLPDLVLRIDRSGTLLDLRVGAAHPGSAMLAGLVGLPLANLVPTLPDVTAAVFEEGMARVREAMTAGTERSFRLRSSAVAADRHYDCRIFPTSPDEVVVLVRDDTDQRRVEEHRAVTEQMATLGTIAAGIAHELNNPLTYTIANASLALEEVERAVAGGPLDLDHLHRTLLDARMGGERAQRIVGDLRLFARGTPDERRPTDLGPVLDSAIAMTVADVRERARMVLAVEQTVKVDGDPSRLGQVFVNLILRATQAIPEGAAADHAIELRASVGSDGWQEVLVRDDGVGYRPDQLGRLFLPFAVDRPGSSGLGLAICHRIVSDLGGRLAVESTVTGGTTFRVRLPPSREVAPPEPIPLGPPLDRPARILVVDDEPLVARAIVRSLGSHRVTAVSSGEEALQLLVGTRFDLVLCDLTLGGIGGLEVREAVRARDPALAERFLFISGGALTEAARSLVASEPERCLSKPFSPVELRARVRAALSRSPG